MLQGEELGSCLAVDILEEVHSSLQFLTVIKLEDSISDQL